jgi:hypothetical protein
MRLLFLYAFCVLAYHIMHIKNLSCHPLIAESQTQQPIFVSTRLAMDIPGALMQSVMAKLAQGESMNSIISGIPVDMRKAVLALAGVGTLKWVMQQQQKRPKYAPLSEPVEAMHGDPQVYEAFQILQMYKEVNPWLFVAAVQNMDQLLHLSRVLVSGRVKPLRTDKVTAFSFLRVGMGRLKAFQTHIYEELGSDHALVANVQVDTIYRQAKTHLLNIMHICSQFKLEDVINRAGEDVKRVIQQRQQRKVKQDFADTVRATHDTTRTEDPTSHEPLREGHLTQT